MKKLFLLLFLACSAQVYAQSDAYQLSTHILNISSGNPAPGVTVELYKYQDSKSSWKKIAEDKTDQSGRIGTFLKGTNQQGTYKLIFRTKPYFTEMNKESFYPFIPVVFSIDDNSHYHVPITLSPFGYSTYRGS